TLPSARFEDTQTPEHDLVVQRTMLGRMITYVRSNPRRTLGLTFQLSRMKSLELETFINIYYRTEWRLTLYDGSVWRVRLTGEPTQRTTIGRSGDTEGGEITEWRLGLTGVKIA